MVVLNVNKMIICY